MLSLTRCILYLAVVFFAPFYSQAQQHFIDRSSFGGQFHYGSFITSEPKAVYVRDSYSYFGELYFQQPTRHPAKTNRQAPHWGAGLFFGHTGSQQYMGKLGGAFSFIKLPLFKYRNFTSGLRLAAGLGWVEKPYDKVTNHKNVIIGTPVNGYVSAVWQNEWKLTSSIFFNTGISFSHLSNGSSTLPNLGLNIPAVSVGMRYSKNSKEHHPPLTPDTISKKWRIQAFTSMGVKQTPWIESKRYLIKIINTEITKKVSNRSQFGMGVFAFYDRSLGIDPLEKTLSKKDVGTIQAGLYTTYAFTVGRLSLPLQVGMPVINRGIRKAAFQQFGIRYAVSKKWTGQALLKTYVGRADVIHFGVGYTIL